MENDIITRSETGIKIINDEFKYRQKSIEYVERITTKSIDEKYGRKYGYQQACFELIAFILDNYDLVEKPKKQ